MYKIGIVGDRDSVLGFMALGFSVHEADSPSAAADKLDELVKSGEYAVIFLVENYAALIEEELKRCADELASTDLSMQTIRDMILEE